MKTIFKTFILLLAIIEATIFIIAIPKMIKDNLDYFSLSFIGILASIDIICIYYLIRYWNKL